MVDVTDGANVDVQLVHWYSFHVGPSGQTGADEAQLHALEVDVRTNEIKDPRRIAGGLVCAGDGPFSVDLSSSFRRCI